MNKQRKARVNLLNEAERTFKDSNVFSDPKLLVGFYRLLKTVAQFETFDERCASIFTLYQIIGKLDKKFCDVIYYRYINNLTLEECGKILNCSHEAIRVREIKAIYLLRAHITEILPTCEADLIKREVLFKNAIESQIPSSDDILVQDLGLSIRASNALQRANIHTASQLCLLNNEQLANIPCLGIKSLREINLVKAKLLNSEKI